MEMIDVLTKLKEIAEKKPELVKDAVENVERTNPKVDESATKRAMEDDAESMTRAEFIEKYGSAMAGFWEAYNGTEESAVQEDTSDDIMQWAKKYSQYKNLEDDNLIEALYDFAFDLGITQMTFEVGELQAAEKKLGKKQEDWEDKEINAAMEMSPISNGLMDELHRILPGNAELEQKLDSIRNMLQKAGLKEAGETPFEGKIPAGLKAYQDKKAGKEEKKETVKEAIQISTDSPQEASMMMQILKLAGVQPVDQAMISQEPNAEEPHAEPEQDDAMGTMQMAKMRDMMTAPEEEKQEETFANEPEEKVSDIDTLVNVHSGGMNRKKSSFKRAEPGDNPMTAEDKVTEEDLANSLRAQYESFKEAYQKEAKIAEAKPDFLDMDKDGDKKEPMKKAIKDKEAK